VQKVREVHKGVWWGNLRERDHLEDLGEDGRIIFKWTSEFRTIRTFLD
jgi:hypothetical protein